MVVEDASVLAIESAITEAYARLNLRALGFFVIHTGGRRYGVREPDATMLACSFDEVGRRIEAHGKHVAPFAKHTNPVAIAEAMHRSMYDLDSEDREYFGMPALMVRDLAYANDLQWAPDGDEAFDDGSHVLQFDTDRGVRVIGHSLPEQGYGCDPLSVRGGWMAADEFYALLQEWRQAFAGEWAAAPKEPEL